MVSRAMLAEGTFEDVTEDGENRLSHAGAVDLERPARPQFHDGVEGLAVRADQVLQRRERRLARLQSLAR